jgi:hypothetical protein
MAAFSLPLTQCTNANFYLKDKWIADDFFRSWSWETEDDPTHGRVNFVSQAEAISKNLSYGTIFLRVPRVSLAICVYLTATSSVENNTFVMRADNSSIVNPSARGRDSVRISSQNAYGDSIVVLDLAHMPAGCATWPGFRTKSQQVQSSASGVIDIIEGTLPSPVSFLPLLTSLIRVLSSCRYQSVRGKSSHFTYYLRVSNAPRFTTPAVWVGSLSAYKQVP